MTTQEEFFQQHAVEGVLPEDKMTEFLMLPVGGHTSTPSVPAGEAEPASTSKEDATATGAEASTGEGQTNDGKTAATTAEVKQPSEAELNAQNAVVLARDGKHTLPFERYEAERTARQQAEARAAALQAEIERLQAAGMTTQQATQQAAATTAAAESAATGVQIDPQKLLEGVDFGDFSDPAVASAIAQLVTKATAPLQAELAALKGKAGEAEKTAELTATQQHYEAIYKAHPDADSIPESREFGTWLGSLPKFQQQAVASALAEGETQDVIDVFSTYKAATGKTGAATASEGGNADTAATAAAQKAIDAAKSKTPSSLTDLPAGTTAHHDPAAALLEMSPAKAMAMFEGKDPAQIMGTLSKVL